MTCVVPSKILNFQSSVQCCQIAQIIPLQKTSFIKPSSYSSIVFESDSFYSLKIMYLVYLILRLSIDTLRGFLPEGEWPCQVILRCQYARRGASP